MLIVIIAVWIPRFYNKVIYTYLHRLNYAIWYESRYYGTASVNIYDYFGKMTCQSRFSGHKIA